VVVLVLNLPLAIKARILRSLGLAGVAALTFDAALAGLTADEFIKQALVAGLNDRKLILSAVVNSNYRVDAGASAVRALVAAPELPTVIFCGNDLIAMGAMNALEEAGVRIPEDVSVIGIDDISFAFLARPPLTTIRVPRERLGTIAFQALDKMLQLKRRKGVDYYLETDLVIRRSTAPPRSRGLGSAGLLLERAR